MESGAEIEVFRHSLRSIVEEMGVTLERTSYSTNIKIRRDYSCALFDSDCRHIAQFSDAPAHVGALVRAVPQVIKERKSELREGDGLLVNDPATGGAVHLPDVMLISPIFANGDIVGYVANSAHHVDIGGSAAGGIPTDSIDLIAEGLIFPGILAVRDWEFDEELLRFVKRNVRGATTREGDFRAQIDANRTGAARFRDLLEKFGADQILTYIDDLITYTERRIRAAIERLPDGTYEASDFMNGDGVADEPIRLAVTLIVEGDSMVINFDGTAEQNQGPINSSPAMTFAGAIHPLQSLLGESFPTNEGFYRPFEMLVPEGSMVNPDVDAPIAGGGEIALRISELVTKAMTDALPEAVIAGAKGTGMNVAYSGKDPRDGDYVYYETFGGGYGARATKDGMEAVQAHCQNTANSPIESLETEIPLYVCRYELIPGSAGAGTQRGGLGLRRDMEFYDHEARFTVLADRTKFPPWGLFGGESGRPATFLVNPEGDTEVLGPKSTTTLEPNDVVSIQTPGGGGYGDPLQRDPDLVLQDIIDEKLTIEDARSDYGVVIETDPLRIDQNATRDLRKQREEASPAEENR